MPERTVKVQIAILLVIRSACLTALGQIISTHLVHLNLKLKNVLKENSTHLISRTNLFKKQFSDTMTRLIFNWLTCF